VRALASRPPIADDRVTYRALAKVELPTRVGDTLDVVAEDLASGWVWCRSGDGREGWVPLKTLDVGT